MHHPSNLLALLRYRLESNMPVTLLAVCPNSAAVLEAAALVSARMGVPILLAATLNQVDRDGGYTGWTPADFVQQMRRFEARYAGALLYPCLDHGGQWQKDSHRRAALSFEACTAEVKSSLAAALAAGYQLLHLDPTSDPTAPAGLPVETIVARSLDLITYAEAERARRGQPPLAYEVGTEEIHGGLTAAAHFESFLQQLRAGIAARGLPQEALIFAVAQVGTDLHTTTFDEAAARQLATIAARYGCLIKGHYTDFVTRPEAYPRAGVGGANVGPEFAVVEYKALAALEAQELSQVKPKTPAGLGAALQGAVLESGRWRKWLLPEEQGKAFLQLSPERRAWLIQTGARYVWTEATVVAARARLYENLAPLVTDAHQVVVAGIAQAIEKYVVAFHLEKLRF